MSNTVRKVLLDFFMIVILIAAIWTVALGFSVLLWNTSSAEGETAPSQISSMQKKRFEEARIQRIHRTVQRMVHNPVLLHRLEEKLRTFDGEKLRLIDELCLQARESRDDPSADVAFLIVTGLIVL